MAWNSSEAKRDSRFAHLGIGGLAHATTECITDERTLVNYCLALEVLVARKRDGLSDPLLWVDLLCPMLGPLASRTDDFGLMTVLSSQFAMCGHHVAQRV